MTRKGLSKYEEVKSYVISYIEDKQSQPHDRIPSESELAAVLDVSSITVRKALSDLVNEGVIYRVRGKGSFVADPKADIAKHDANLVVFVISGIQIFDSSYMQIMKGIQSFLSQHNYRLIVEFVENDFEQERELIMSLLQMDYSGLLIYSADPNSAKKYLKELKRSGKRFVMLDRYPNAMPVNCVICNNHDGAYEATEYLIGLGHRHIGFAAYDFFLISENERYNGYMNALEESGIPLDRSLVFLEKELDYDLLLTKIKSKELSALFCVNDRRGLEAIHQLSERGVRIPEELSVMGFDDFESSKYAKVPLSTVKQDFEELGYEGARLLLDIIHDKEGSMKILLPTKLVIRESTAIAETARTR